MNTTDRAIGIGRLAGTVDSRGRRSSPAKAYITPDVLARPKLTVATSIYVEKILLSLDDNIPGAAGVQVAASEENAKYRATANKKVILSAGALSSPHPLFVSGIGSADEWKSNKSASTIMRVHKPRHQGPISP